VARQRPSRSEVKQPDPFLSWSARAIAWAKDHTRHLLYGVLGAVVVVGLIVAWFSWQYQRRQRAAALLYEAHQLLDATPEATNAPASEQALGLLRTIIDDYGRTPAAAQAYWQLGHLYFVRGDYTAALTAYEQAQRHISNNRELSSVLVTLDVAYAQEVSGACDKALVNYETVQQSSAGWLHGEAYLGMGRCHEQRHATDEAIVVYERALADTNVTGAARQTISERLARLQPVDKTPAAQSQATGTESPATSAPEGTAEQEPAKEMLPATSAPAAPPPQVEPGKEPSAGAPATNP
jgi:predicted negative regulator of RcsB-dependent stress response